MAIVRVQGNARGVGTSSPISVTLGATPTQGNTLIATIAANPVGAYANVDSITETGVSWSKIVQSDPSGGLDIEIWMGTVSSGASTSVSVAITGTEGLHAVVVDICEYSGLASNPTDKTATNSSTSGTQTDTGTTATTTQADELWIGAICGYEKSQSSPTNGFTLLDGAYYNVVSGVSNGYLEKIVSATGVANSGTTLSGSNYWSGCIATFKAVEERLKYKGWKDWWWDSKILAAKPQLQSRFPRPFSRPLDFPQIRPREILSNTLQLQRNRNFLNVLHVCGC